MNRRGLLAASAAGLLVGAGPPMDEPSDDAPPGAAATGSLSIQAVQGTPGGPALGASSASVELYHRGVLVETRQVPLDEQGAGLVEGLPLAMECQPVVQVVYRDLAYRQNGAVIDAAHPQQNLQVVCYEPTEDMPSWTVSMWHVLIDRVPQGFAVTELVAVDNPANRTWIGAEPSGGGRRITTAFALPAGAADVRLSRGFHDWSSTTRNGDSLDNHLPLMPAITEYKFSYVVPATSGQAEIGIVAPAPVGQVMMVLPVGITVVSARRVEFVGTQDAGATQLAAYSASGLGRGDGAALTLEILAAAPVSAGGSAVAARFIAAIGAGLLLLGAAAVLLRPRRGAAAALEHRGGRP